MKIFFNQVHKAAAGVEDIVNDAKITTTATATAAAAAATAAG